MAKLRQDVYLTASNYLKLLQFQAEHKTKNISQAIDIIINRHFKQLLEQDASVERLNKVIQQYENKVLNLEHQITVLKEVKKNECSNS
jgi:hypothetical protein